MTAEYILDICIVYAAEAETGPIREAMRLQGVNDVEQSGPLKVQVQLTLFLPFLCHLPTVRQVGRQAGKHWLNGSRIIWGCKTRNETIYLRELLCSYCLQELDQ